MVNDTIVNNLESPIEPFMGGAAHTRCLDHVLHLSAQSLLCPFDVATGREAGTAQTATWESLRELAAGLDLEECEMQTLDLGGADSKGTIDPKTINGMSETRWMRLEL